MIGCKETFVTEAEIEATKKSIIPSVKVVNVIATNEPIPIEASGTVGSKAEINLSFKIELASMPYSQNARAQIPKPWRGAQSLLSTTQSELDLLHGHVMFNRTNSFPVEKVRLN